MTTIVEPRKHIADLWSIPVERNGQFFRLMRYVMREDHNGKVLLHNVVTGQLMVLEQNEAEVLNLLPLQYVPTMDQLIDGHYLVPVQYDEHLQVHGMRSVLQKLNAVQDRDASFTRYTILPTTGCNARCYYCFEQGIKKIVMSEQVAEDVSQFIVNHCDKKKKVLITWFGGEPTTAADRIDLISDALSKNGIEYQSSMISNGYLFDAEMVSKAKTLWNLRRIQITLDGTETSYNRTKAYVNVKDNPYQRVMRNIGLLLDAGVHVNLRMNIDVGNWHEFDELLEEVRERFQGQRFLQMYAHPVIGEYRDSEGNIHHGEDDWFVEQLVDLNETARKKGLRRKDAELPSLTFIGCFASYAHSIVIGADGKLFKCMEVLGEDQYIGNIYDGITNSELARSWEVAADYQNCADCVLFPRCMRVRNCPSGNRCLVKEDRKAEFSHAIKEYYNNICLGRI